jgi:hypothetical protein
MFRPVDCIALLALLGLLAMAVEAHTWRPDEGVPARPELVRDPAEPVDGATTRFDLLFRQPELARP